MEPIFVHYFLGPKLDAIPDYFDHFTSIHWSLEAIIETRAKLIMKPKALVNIEMKFKDESMQFQVEPQLLKDLTKSLENALKLMKGQEAKKFQRQM